MIKIKKILLNPWTVGIGTTVISALLLKFIAIFTGTTIFGILLKVAVSAVRYGQSIFGLKLSVGTILITCFAIIAMLILIKRWLNWKTAKNTPPYLGYTEDAFQNIYYRWEYNFVGGKYHIGSIQAYCPTCKCRIVHRECQACKTVFINMKDKKQTEAIIAYGIETKFNINEFKELGRQ